MIHRRIATPNVWICWGGQILCFFESKIVAFCQCWFKKRSGIEIIFDPIYALCHTSYICLGTSAFFIVSFVNNLLLAIAVYWLFKQNIACNMYIIICQCLPFNFFRHDFCSFGSCLLLFSSFIHFFLQIVSPWKNHFASGYVWCRNQAWCRSSASLAAENELWVENDSLYQLDSPTWFVNAPNFLEWIVGTLRDVRK